MARHNGKNGKVKFGADFIDGLVSFSIDEEVSISDSTASEDAWESHTVGIKKWSGQLTFRADHEAAANQSLRAGDELAFEGYTEGDASGKKYLEGNVTVGSHGISHNYNDTVERTYQVTGNGELTISTVA